MLKYSIKSLILSNICFPKGNKGKKILTNVKIFDKIFDFIEYLFPEGKQRKEDFNKNQRWLKFSIKSLMVKFLKNIKKKKIEYFKENFNHL